MRHVPSMRWVATGSRAEIRERLYVVDQDAKTQGAKEALREGE